MVSYAKKYGLTKEEELLVKQLDPDRLSDALADLEDIEAYTVEQAITDNNLYLSYNWGSHLYSYLNFDTNISAYIDVISLDDVRAALDKAEADGYTHIDEDEYALYEVKIFDQKEKDIIKKALYKFKHVFDEEYNKKEQKSKAEKIRNAKKMIAAKRKEIADLEKVLADA